MGEGEILEAEAGVEIRFLGDRGETGSVTACKVVTRTPFDSTIHSSTPDGETWIQFVFLIFVNN